MPTYAYTYAVTPEYLYTLDATGRVMMHNLNPLNKWLFVRNELVEGVLNITIAVYDNPHYELTLPRTMVTAISRTLVKE